MKKGEKRKMFILIETFEILWPDKLKFKINKSRTEK